MDWTEINALDFHGYLSQYSGSLQAGRLGFNSRQGQWWGFSLRHRVSGSHSHSCPMSNGSVTPGAKRPGCEADHSLFVKGRCQECVELYLHSPTTSWCDA